MLGAFTVFWIWPKRPINIFSEDVLRIVNDYFIIFADSPVT